MFLLLLEHHKVAAGKFKASPTQTPAHHRAPGQLGSKPCLYRGFPDIVSFCYPVQEINHRYVTIISFAFIQVKFLREDEYLRSVA